MEVPPDQGRHRGGSGSTAPRPATTSNNPKKADKKGKEHRGWLVKKQVTMAKNVDEEEEEIASQLSHLHLDTDIIVQGTALCYDERLTEPRCAWDSQFPERPERVTTVMQKMQEYRLIERCKLIEARHATEKEILLAHSSHYVEQIKSTEKMTTDELEKLACSYDMVFLHERTYAACCLAVGCVLQVVDQVMTGQVRNGLAVVRPPGHSALSDSASGYCIFNNLAVAAMYAKKQHNVKRVLIVDWDVHHGQGTQYIFDEDPSVLYFSIHRFEHGDFWPHLPESDCTAVGEALGKGYNINVPWNKTSMSDADYIAVFHNILMPVAQEFQPNLILVAAGFSSVIGDPQGDMLVSPSCFAHLTHMLLPLATGKLILSLEGGYNLRATAEAMCACLKIMLGDPCPMLELPYVPRQCALESISAVIVVHRKYWKSLQNRETGMVQETFPNQPRRQLASDLDVSLDHSMQEVMRSVPIHRTGLVYDERMKEHRNLWDYDHPEQPQRIVQIFARHQELHLVERCVAIPATLASEADLELCHEPKYIQALKASRNFKPRDLHKQSHEYNSIYISNQSYDSAVLAVGSTCNVVEAVLTEKVLNGVAIVRPPGHHAEKDTAYGFCFFNNVALAARYAQNFVGSKIRVLILDWDIHHGNGTQHMFEDDPSILYISLHRYDHGTFFPNSEEGNYDKVGKGNGEGFNVNIPWNGSRMGDPEYMTAFQSIVMPISYQFQPELVLISAGFDAARGDPLGGCQVSPECYAHMTHMLKGLAGGRVVVVLEGGYNLMSISESMAMCTRTLLGDMPPYLDPLTVPLPSALETFSNVIRVQRKYWSCLRLLIPDLEHQIQPMMTRRASLWGQQQPPVTLGTNRTETASGQSTSSDTQQESGSKLDSALGSTPSHGQSLDTEQGSAETPVQPRRISLWQGPDPAAPSLDADWNPSKDVDVQPPSPAVRRKAKAATSSAPTQPKSQPQTLQIPERDDSVLSTTSTSKAESDSEGEYVPRETRCRYPDKPDFNPTAEPGTVFAVTPLTSCPHLKAALPVPDQGLDVMRPCYECGAEGENWVCLSCYKVYCGRYVNAHMEEHWQITGHPLVLSYADLSSWCYVCDAYIHHEVLLPVKEEAHRLKFGQDLVS